MKKKGEYVVLRMFIVQIIVGPEYYKSSQSGIRQFTTNPKHKVDQYLCCLPVLIHAVVIILWYNAHGRRHGDDPQANSIHGYHLVLIIWAVLMKIIIYMHSKYGKN